MEDRIVPSLYNDFLSITSRERTDPNNFPLIKLSILLPPFVWKAGMGGQISAEFNNSRKADNSSLVSVTPLPIFS